jgi:hypothetical protein
MGPRRDASGGRKFVGVSVPRGGALFSPGAEADDASLGKAQQAWQAAAERVEAG